MLCSGGLDSAVLLGCAARDGRSVVPIYVRTGLAWEAVEREYLQRYLAAIASPNLRPLVTLALPVGDLYDSHWSLTGCDVPHSETEDSAVYLPGRNVILLSKALVWCHLNGVPALALAILKANPFPDATPEFFRAMAAVVNQAVGGSVRIETPYAELSKVEVIRRGQGLPLEQTFSCIAPVEGRHCGRCNKCAQRRAGVCGGGSRRSDGIQ